MKRYVGHFLLLLPFLAAAGMLCHQELLPLAQALWSSSSSVRADDKEPEPPAAVKALAEALQDKDAEVRKNAAQSLGRIGKEAKFAVKALTEALKDTDLDVRGASALALGRIGKEAVSAAPALAEVLK